MRLFFIKILCIIFISTFVSFYGVDLIVMKDFDDLLSSMVDISSALFAAVGIWVAYLYPEAISVLTERKNVTLMNGIDHTRKVEKLVVNMLISASVLLAILFLKFSQVFFANIPFIVEYKIIFKGVAIFSVSMMCLMQAYSLFSLMLVNVSFISRLHNVKGERQASDDL
ncbi:hypothetical protein [Rheinheimera sp.]|uniref:hypothetical protein n=1 Tax=Rheinheimera sp. TaxID=1869214 RepID=UPI0027BA632D|nr:hypothetical protein [Rheinheimera sp.]